MINKGLYIHVPFCKSKCPYCDFYSLRGNSDDMDAWENAVCDELKTGRRAGLTGEKYLFDSVYFGGGTPSLVGADRLKRILDSASRVHTLTGDCEITVECNPSSADDGFIREISSAANRLSIGLQSADDSVRRKLGRLSGSDEAKRCVETALGCSVENISLDVMLGVPGSTREKLTDTLDFCVSVGAKHVSAYMLTIEEGTVFDRRRAALNLPAEDETCDDYLFAFDYLESKGLRQYEISNAAAPGFESRHNLKYWRQEEYLGVGPAAHSFIDGKRFGYSRSLDDFIAGKAPEVYDSGGGEEEYIMLALRLREGLCARQYKEKFGRGLPENLTEKARDLEKNGLVETFTGCIRLTRRGMLLSNAVIAELLSCLPL